MKNLMKLFLVMSLFVSSAFADGDMGGGGKTCPQGQTCLGGDMGGGGKATDDGTTADTDSWTETTDAVLVFVTEYLKAIF